MQFSAEAERDLTLEDFQAILSHSGFSNATGSTPTEVKVSREHSPRNILLSARHDSPTRSQPSRCHPNTRHDILQSIFEWQASITTGAPWCKVAKTGRKKLVKTANRIFWLKGPSGAGKTAIAQSVAERCASDGTLAASFFFAPGGQRVHEEKILFASIAYQLAECLGMQNPTPDKEVLEEVVGKGFDEQSKALLLEPFMEVFEQSHKDEVAQTKTMLIVVDGIDEGMHPYSIQTEALSCIIMLSSRFTEQNIPLCFLVTSRDEPEKLPRNVFREMLKGHPHSGMKLRPTFQAIRDVETFLRSELQVLRTAKVQNSEVVNEGEYWPTDEDIEILVRRSKGSFVYPAILLNYLRDNKGSESPQATLKSLNSATVAGSTAYRNTDLDVLYQEILCTTPDKEILLRILGYILISRPFTTVSSIDLTPGIIETMLDLIPGTVLTTLRGSNSILRIDVSGQDSSIEYLHASLVECLFDPFKGGLFYCMRRYPVHV
ncbi:hypothetical protein H0H92_007507 [Tricholoma furcatifolium]|nr:hypothetical protein H0H92_007507 [Tricholoma furcatifolium]